MPISVECPACGKRLKAPDSAVGKRAPCPQCGGTIEIPAATEFAGIEDPQPPSIPAGGPQDFDSALTPSASSEGARKPCPVCGELIVPTAAKCRYCGEVFDPALRRKSGAGASEEDTVMATSDWVICILCSGIGCIMGIVYLAQGKPKGLRMLGVSLGVGFVYYIILAIIGAVIEVAQ